MIFGGDLDANLQVLANVVGEHSLQAFQRVLHGKGAEKANEPFSAQ